MTLTNDYQYIGRSNGVFNFGGAYQYYLLLYAKTSGSTATGKHRVSVKMRLACQIGVHFYGYNTTGYAKVAGQSAISWTAQPKPNAEWNQNLTEGGVTYPRWIDLQEGSTDVNVGYGATKDVTLEAYFQRLDMAVPPDFVPQTTPMTISIGVTLPVIIPEAEAKPVVSMTLKPVSSLAAPFNGMYIQNLTKVDAELSAEGKYGATITSLQMVIGNAVYGDPYISGYLTQTGNVAVIGKATDSRGLVGTTEQTINVIPYSKPAIVPAEGQTDIVCARCDADGNFTDSGTYLRIIARRDYKPVDGKNFCTIRYRVIGGSWVTILEGSAAGDEVDKVISGVVTSTTASYSIEIGVVDTLGNTSSVTKIVPTDKVDIHLRDGGGGVAFGGYCTQPGFTCYMDARFLGSGMALSDYVVDEGADSVWRWRKWNSGKVELVGTTSSTADITTARGAIYASELQYLSLPFTLYDSNLWVDCSDINVWASIGSFYSETNLVTYRLWSGINLSGYTWYVKLLATGNWK